MAVTLSAVALIAPRASLTFNNELNMKKTKSEISVGPVREDGTFHTMITREDGTNITMRLSANKEIPSGEDLEARLRSIAERKRKEGEPTTRRRMRLQRFGWERGLWRLYLLGAAIWGIAIIGMLILSLLETAKIHRDVFQSLVAAVIVLPLVFTIYLVGRELAIRAIWPPIKWIVEGFIRK